MVVALHAHKDEITGIIYVRRGPCYDVASVRKCDGALRHDTFSSNAGHVRVSRERNAAVGCFKLARYFSGLFSPRSFCLLYSKRIFCFGVRLLPSNRHCLYCRGHILIVGCLHCWDWSNEFKPIMEKDCTWECF